MHEVPVPRHELVQYPPLQVRPEQQGYELEHDVPEVRHVEEVQYPLLQVRPEQQGDDDEQDVPDERHAVVQ